MYHDNFSQSTDFYRLSARVNLSGTTAVPLFSFRWSSTSHLALLHSLRIRWQTGTAFTAAQALVARAFKGTVFTGSHTGGTAITPVKKESRMAASRVTDCRIGALGGGTVTRDSQEFGGLWMWSQYGAAPNVIGFETLILPDQGSRIIIGMAQDEGFVIDNILTLGAGGTADFIVECDWAEIPK